MFSSRCRKIWALFLISVQHAGMNGYVGSGFQTQIKWNGIQTEANAIPHLGNLHASRGNDDVRSPQNNKVRISWAAGLNLEFSELFVDSWSFRLLGGMEMTSILTHLRREEKRTTVHFRATRAVINTKQRLKMALKCNIWLLFHKDICLLFVQQL